MYISKYTKSNYICNYLYMLGMVEFHTLVVVLLLAISNALVSQQNDIRGISCEMKVLSAIAQHQTWENAVIICQREFCGKSYK